MGHAAHVFYDKVAQREPQGSCLNEDMDPVWLAERVNYMRL